MRLNHIDLEVPDVVEASAFFQEHFGLRETYRRGCEIALLDDGGGMLLGVSSLFGPKSPSYPRDFHIGFRLETEDEVRAKYEAMKAADIPIRADLQRGGPAVYFVCLGPGGVAIEVSAVLGPARPDEDQPGTGS